MLMLPLVAVLAAAAPAKHAYTVQDQVAMKRLGDFDVSPDGSKVVYTLRTTDLEANKGRTDLWLVNADGTNSRQLTSHPEADSDARWAPDGKSIFFISTRSGSSQVWRIQLDGGEPQQVTKLAVDVNAFRVTRDGSTIVFATDVFPDCDTIECTTKRLDEQSKKKSSGKIYDQLFIRHWDSWADGRRSHLFAIPVAGGTAVDLMKKMNADSPSKPFGGAEEFSVSPDGKSVVFTARDVGREEAWSTNLDLFVSPLDGKTAPKKLTTSQATDTAPLFSPDGKQLAYLAMARPGFEADKLSVMVRVGVDGKDRNLSTEAAWDRSPSSIFWSADGKTLYAVAEDVGNSGLFAFDVASGKVRTIRTGKGNLAAAAISQQSFVASIDTLTAPTDLHLVSADGTTAKPITQVNADTLPGIKFGDYEQFSFAGANDEKVYGFIVKPVDFDAKKKYPLAFLIHGGPQGSFGDHFHYRWNPQTYAGHGYVAVMIDFHGSTGYGQAFTDAISGDWGGKPLQDLQKGYAAAVQKYSFIDKSRACALGASYGGFMVNYIAGKWQQPFKCLVSHDGNLDEAMAYYDTEELWFPEWEHGGLPWEKPEGYQKANPIDGVKDWKLPMLVIHGGRDYRVVDTQGMATFTALQRRGIPSKFLYFPDENHWVLKPANSVLWHETVLGWLDQWTKAK